MFHTVPTLKSIMYSIFCGEISVNMENMNERICVAVCLGAAVADSVWLWGILLGGGIGWFTKMIEIL